MKEYGIKIGNKYWVQIKNINWPNVPGGWGLASSSNRTLMTKEEAEEWLRAQSARETVGAPSILKREVVKCF